MKKTLIIVGVVVLLGLGVYFFQSGSSDVVTSTDSPTPIVSESPSPLVSSTISPSVSPTATGVSTMKTFTVVGKPFSFTPAQITVNKGDTVKIVFKNESGTHDWRLDEFNAKTNVIQGGKEETIQFVADKVGTFEYYCSVGTHRQMGMKGNLIVK